MIDSLVKFGLNLVIFLGLLFVLPFLPWPDLPTTEIGNGLANGMATIYAWNEQVPIDTVVNLGITIFLIELSLVLMRLITKIVSHFSGNQTLTKN